MIKTSTLLICLTSLSAWASTLVVVGGGVRPNEAIEAFVKASSDKPILVIPWGTSTPTLAFEQIQSQLLANGAKDIQCWCQPTDTNYDPAEIEKAGGIWFPGGDQIEVMKNLHTHNLTELIQKRFKEGMAVGGTSAGTAIQSSPMMKGIESQTDDGLGLFTGVLVDQHFLLRHREPRLIEALSNLKNSGINRVGLGIDEGMSVVAHLSETENTCEVIGPSQDDPPSKLNSPTEVRLYTVKEGDDGAIEIEQKSFKNHEQFELVSGPKGMILKNQN